MSRRDLPAWRSGGWRAHAVVIKTAVLTITARALHAQVLEDRLTNASSCEEGEAARRELVQFHGELVLLLHFSMLNLAAVAKILKKHGACARA